MHSKTELTAFVKEAACDCGFDLVGVAPPRYGEHIDHLRTWLDRGFHGEMQFMSRSIERRTHLQNVLPGVQSVICVALNYHCSFAADENPACGRISACALNRDYHEIMKSRLTHLVNRIAALAPAARFEAFADAGPVLEKSLAQSAGLGWIGKHTLLISRDIGSWFFLGEILTDLELDFDAPHANFCGDCERCIQACPTGAIVAPYQLDARRCISYLTIESKGEIPVPLRPLIGNRIYGCDECQRVCPWNRFAKQTKENAFLPRDDLKQLHLTDLISLSEKQFNELFRGSPIRRIKRGGLLRNVAVALGNSRQPNAIAMLETMASEGDALVHAHAVWALRELQCSRKAGNLRPPVT